MFARVVSEKSKNPGMLLVPVWITPLSNYKSETQNAWDHQRPVVSTLYSLDKGETWQLGDVIFPTEEIPDPNETAAVELSDGSVMFNMRNTNQEVKRRAVTVSATGYDNWANPQFDHNLPDPICFASLVRYDKDTILFVNCNNDFLFPENPVAWMAPRINLTVRASRDDGKTWEKSKVLIPGRAGYSDITVAPDGMIYVLYDIDHGDTSMNLLSFDLDWIYGE
jgi:sialidase-1